MAILNWGGDPGSSFHREKGKWLPFVVVVGGEGRRSAGVLRWMVDLGCQSQSYKQEILLIHENAGKHFLFKANNCTASLSPSMLQLPHRRYASRPSQIITSWSGGR